MKSLNGGGRHPEVEVRKLLSDDVISLDDIQKLISKAHSDNIKNGLFYATASQTIEKLRQKIGDGVCFIAEENGKLIGTATVCSKKINYWYYSGTVFLSWWQLIRTVSIQKLGQGLSKHVFVKRSRTKFK